MSAPRLESPNPAATAVPVYLPLGFIVAGIAGMLLLVLALPGTLPSAAVYVRHHARLLVLVHLFTLVWGSGVTLGVLHQMAPVILCAPLHSVRLGWLALGLYVPGSFLFALSFRSFWLAGVIAGGVLVLAASLAFAYNIARTAGSARERNVTTRFLVPAILSFAGTLALGIAMAASVRLGAGYTVTKGLLLAHLFLGGAGWFTGIIIATAYRLVPMFLLVHGHGEGAAGRILAVHYAGVALGVAGSLRGGPHGAAAGALLILAAVAMWARDLASMWKKRVRPPDVWMHQVPVAAAFMVASAAGAAACAVWNAAQGGVHPRVMLAVGVLFSLGGVSVIVLALLHKIVPFLVWCHRCGDAAGRGRAPAMKDLVNERIGTVAFPVFEAAVVVIAAGVALDEVILAQAAAWALALACAFLVHDLIGLIAPAGALNIRRARGKVREEVR